MPRRLRGRGVRRLAAARPSSADPDSTRRMAARMSLLAWSMPCSHRRAAASESSGVAAAASSARNWSRRAALTAAIVRGSDSSRALSTCSRSASKARCASRAAFAATWDRSRATSAAAHRSPTTARGSAQGSADGSAGTPGRAPLVASAPDGSGTRPPASPAEATATPTAVFARFGRAGSTGSRGRTSPSGDGATSRIAVMARVPETATSAGFTATATEPRAGRAAVAMTGPGLRNPSAGRLPPAVVPQPASMATATAVAGTRTGSIRTRVRIGGAGTNACGATTTAARGTSTGRSGQAASSGEPGGGRRSQSGAGSDSVTALRATIEFGEIVTRTSCRGAGRER